MRATAADQAPRPRRSARVRDWWLTQAHALAPSRAAWFGATAGTLSITVVVWIALAIEIMSDDVVGPLVVTAAIVLAVVWVTGLVIFLLWVFRLTPLYFRWAALFSTLLLAILLFLSAPMGAMLIVVSSLIMPAVGAMAGGAVGSVLAGRWRRSSAAARVATLICGIVGLGSVVAAGAWLFADGPPREKIVNAAASAASKAVQTSLPDPASQGPYGVRMLTYGSGEDSRRPEFGAAVALRTDPADASKILHGWEGITGWARTRFFGFDEKRLPLNGTVWYPRGNGPFPLVLIVHGNHNGAENSDQGYEYLGRLLASRGYIVVTVDENFFNGLVTDLDWGLEQENNARGWLLLEHLRVWHAWNADETSPFWQKVDTANIALVGHSRGGEAVAHAAAFNRLPYYPDNAKVRFDYGYQIKSLAAIAPADGQYRPAGARTQLSNINYFTIQGAHDSDVSSFVGLNQYDRVALGGNGDWFKSAVYVYGANHGQFNTCWGAFDVGAGLSKRLVSTAALLDAADQRRILQVYLSAYLDCTLRGKTEYRRLFEDWRYGAAWLPQTVYLTQYADAAMRPVCTFDEDIDLSTATVDGGKTLGENLTLWREGQLALRSEPNEDRAVVIGWDRDSEEGMPRYEISWPNGAVELGNDSVLSFCLADGNEDPTPDDDDDPRQRPSPQDDASSGDTTRDPIDLTVELVDAEGHTAQLPLSHYSPLQPQMDTLFLKSSLLHQRALSEPILQTFLFSLDDFQRASAEFDPAAAVTMRLVFNRTKSGVVIFDKLAISAPRSE